MNNQFSQESSSLVSRLERLAKEEANKSKTSMRTYSNFANLALVDPSMTELDAVKAFNRSRPMKDDGSDVRPA